MSLLLDALKKAANEKKSADSSNMSVDEPNELELETLEASAVAAEETPDSTLSTSTTLSDEKSLFDDSNRLSVETVSGATPLTVTNEALQLLVHKANKQFKTRQTLLWFGAALSTLVVLLMGGGYFYYNMADDMASLERKHRLVMRSVNDAQLSRSITEKRAQQKILEESQQVNTKPQNKIVAIKVRQQNTFQKLVIKKAKKLDPVNVLVTKAWRHYSQGEYTAAKLVYIDVLSRERNNRDALLGTAAIAFKQKDIERAKSIYGELIELNPRDPIAVAALINLEKVGADTMSESRLKFLIQKNDETAHLYFALGNIYSKQSRWPEAQKSYFKALKSDNDNADYAFNLAVSLDQMGKQKEAITFYKVSMEKAKTGNAEVLIKAVESRLLQLTSGLKR